MRIRDYSAVGRNYRCLDIENGRCNFALKEETSLQILRYDVLLLTRAVTSRRAPCRTRIITAMSTMWIPFQDASDGCLNFHELRTRVALSRTDQIQLYSVPLKFGRHFGHSGIRRNSPRRQWVIGDSG